MKKLLFLTAILCFSSPFVLAYDLDLSVDDEIQKNYDANKLNEDVQNSSPNEILKNKNSKSVEVKRSSTVPTSTPIFDAQAPSVTADNSKYKRSGIKIPKWTTFKVKSNQKISDWNSLNSTVSFTTTQAVYKRFVTIQSGTLFKGTITKIHHPQLTGNGALVEIKINSMTYNGKTIPVEGKITKANSELVFFNKIKGDRQYLNGVEKKIKSANNFYTKTRNTSNKLAQNPIGVIVSPIPTIVGFAGGAVGTAISPLSGLIEKGKNVSLPANTVFEIRLLSDAYIN